MREYLWSKFLQTCAIFRREKKPQKGGFMDAASPRKRLNIYTLTATYAKLMKLTTSMYLHKKLYLAEDWGVTYRA